LRKTQGTAVIPQDKEVPMTLLTNSPAWQALKKHQQEIANVHIRDLFAQDPQRFVRFSLWLEDILFDYSKNRITEKTISLLMDLACQANLSAKIEAMFHGEKIYTGFC
jgi:glucose-6-phosphate isomerase